MKDETRRETHEKMLQDVRAMGSAWSVDGERISPTAVYKMCAPPKPVGAWILDPRGWISTHFMMYSKPTDEQIKNTEAAFGWKWKDFPDAQPTRTE